MEAGRHLTHPFSVVGAIERVEQIWRSTRNNAVSDLIIAQHLGHQTLNGSSRANIAGMKKYGLLETSGKDKLRLTDAAKVLAMLPSDNPEYVETAWQAALRPPIFSELYESYGFDLPDDKSLQYYLVGKNYLPDAARDVVRTYRQTLEYLQQIGPSPNHAGIEEVRQTPTANAASSSISASNIYSGQNLYATTADLHLSLFDGCKAHVIFEGKVTKKSLAKLSRYLELFAEDYEDEQELLTAPNLKSTGRNGYDRESLLALPVPDDEDNEE